MRKRLSLAVTASLVIGSAVPAFALEPVASPSPGSTAVSCPNPYGGGECLGPLGAGTYRTTVFETPFTVTVPDGWTNYEDESGNFLLVPPGGSLDGVDAGSSDYVGIYMDVAVSEATCQPMSEPGVGTDAAAMAEALAARDGLLVSEPVPVEVGGLSGYMIDIATDLASEAGCQVPELAFSIVPLIIGTGPASLEHAQMGDLYATRLYLLDHGDTNIAIEVSDVESSPGATNDYEPVIDSIEFSLG